MSSTALPKVDLSVSIKSHYLTDRFHPWVTVFLRYQRQLEVTFMTSIALCISIPYMKTGLGSVLSIMALLFALPVGLGSIGALRLEVVRIVLKDDNVRFFCITNLLTQVLNGTLFGDLRALLVIVNFISMLNVVLIDARLRGIRHFTYLASLGLVSTVSLFVSLMLDLVDQPHGASLWQYTADKIVYRVSVGDYVMNGYVCYWQSSSIANGSP